METYYSEQMCLVLMKRRDTRPGNLISRSRVGRELAVGPLKTLPVSSAVKKTYNI